MAEMTDYQRIVEFLRDYRMSPGQAVTDEVRRYAADYASLCASANERLRQCSTFLQQGLRSEAMHLADESPSLLELVAALDLPDAQAWIEFCQHNELPVPPPLQIDRATQLNDAYGLEGPVEQLLRRHRRLALCRAPLKARLATMRDIAALSPGAFWEKDLRLFEGARLKELKTAFAAALRDQNNQATGALAAEILETSWLEPLPEELRTAAEQARQRLQLAAVSVNLRDLLERLRVAFAARSHAQCADLAAQIKKLLNDASQGVSTEVAAELKPILAWIAQEDDLLKRRQAMQQACQRLTEALDADAPDARLEPLYQKTRQFRESIPQQLEERYRQKLLLRQRASQRRFWLGIAALAAVLLLALGGAAWYLRTQAASTWVRKIHNANEARLLTQARQVIADQERLVPRFNDDPDLVAAKNQTAALQEQYDHDTVALGQLLHDLGAEVQAATQAIQTPDASIPLLLAAADRAQGRLQQARAATDLAWADGEKKLRPATQQLEALELQLRQAATTKAQDRLYVLGQQFYGLKADATSQEQLAAMEPIAQELAMLQRQPSLDDQAKAPLAALAGRLERKQRELTQGLNQTEQLRTLRRRATSVASWGKAMQDFQTRFPDAPLSKDFARAMEMHEGAEAIEALHNLVAGWAGEFAPSGEAPARDRLKALKEYLSDHAHSPYAPQVDAYAAYLKQAADALAVKNSWQEAFHELLSSPIMSDLQCITTSDGSRYYVLGDADIRYHRMNEQVFITFDAIEPSNITKRRTITVMPPAKLLGEKPALSAHADFVAKLTAQMKEIHPENWDTFGVTVADQLLKDKSMDLVVKAILLQQTLQAATQITGWGLAGLYDRSLEDLARQGPESIVWYDPDRPVPATTVDALKKIMDSVPSAEVALAAIKDHKARIFKAVACDYAVMGVLMRDEKGAWTIYAEGVPASSVVAVAAGPLPKDVPVAPLLQVATGNNGRFTINDAAVADLPEGTVVFIGRP